MKKLLLPLLLLFISFASAQKTIKTDTVTDHSIHIQGNNFEGIVFSTKYIMAGFVIPNSKLFKLTTADVILSEKLLKQQVINKQNQVIQDPFIRKNLKKYLRQYVGFTDSKGQKCIFINFFWKAEVLHEEREHKQFPKVFPEPKWKSQWELVNDGGHFYWQIKINLSSGKLFDYMVNGLA